MTDQHGARGTQRVNWETIRERLAAVADTLAANVDAGGAAAEARTVLEARAHVLAQSLVDGAGAARPGVEAAGADERAVLFVRVSEARFAVPATAVLEVARPVGLTPLPGAEAPVVAAFAWRGRMLAVFDVQPAAGGAPRVLTALSRVVVVGEGRAAVGLLVDAAEDVQLLAAAEIYAAGRGAGAAAGPAGVAGAVVGVTADAVTVLDVSALVNARPLSP